MADLWMAIAELAASTHADRIAMAADAISELNSVLEFDRAKFAFGPNVDQALVDRLRFAWKASPSIGSKEITSAFKAAVQAVSLMETRGALELVWTGPKTGLIPTRNTEQVLCEVIDSARNRLFIVSFVAYEISLITRALRDAVSRQVQVDVLLESSRRRGGKITVDSVKTMKETVPHAKIYVWHTGTPTKHANPRSGSVHAKCAVSDGRLAFITSANLSTAAMERNMELGILVRGGHLPDELHRHLETLVTTDTVKRV